MTTLYLAGPMRGIPEYNFPSFREAATALRAAGYGVVSPHELHSGALDLPWAEYMRRDLALLCSGAIGGVALLPAWVDSQGAALECQVAVATGLDVRQLSGWLVDAREGAHGP